MSISAGQSFTGLRSFHRWSGLLVWLSLQPQLYAQDQVRTPLQTRVQARIQTPEEGLSFSFQDIEVRAVLQLLAEDNDLNLVVSEAVTGNITLQMENVPWE